MNQIDFIKNAVNDQKALISRNERDGRAIFCLVESVVKEFPQLKSLYVQYCKTLPLLLRRSGLCGALGWLFGRAGNSIDDDVDLSSLNAEALLLVHLCATLWPEVKAEHDLSDYANAKQLVDDITKYANDAPLYEYMRLYCRAEAMLEWYRLYADALILPGPLPQANETAVPEELSGNGA